MILLNLFLLMVVICLNLVGEIGLCYLMLFLAWFVLYCYNSVACVFVMYCLRLCFGVFIRLWLVVMLLYLLCCFAFAFALMLLVLYFDYVVLFVNLFVLVLYLWKGLLTYLRYCAGIIVYVVVQILGWLVVYCCVTCVCGFRYCLRFAFVFVCLLRINFGCWLFCFLECDCLLVLLFCLWVGVCFYLVVVY